MPETSVDKDSDLRPSKDKIGLDLAGSEPDAMGTRWTKSLRAYSSKNRHLR